MIDQEKLNQVIMKVQSKIPLDQSEIDLVNEVPDDNFKKQVLALNKYNSGQELTNDEREIVRQIEEASRQSQNDISQELMIPEAQRDAYRFQKETQQHIAKGGKRIIHITDTESSPQDLEEILKMDLSHAGGFHKKTDIIVHTGDMIEDLIDFKTLHHGTQGFLPERIVDEGDLEGKIADEFVEAYRFLLEKNGISEYQLLEGQLNEQMLQSLQRLYFGITPNFLTNQEKNEYVANLEKFKKHMKTAIKNNARSQYKAAKKTFESEGLTPEDLIIVEGNHDVPEVMREVLGEYMPRAGTVVERKGLRFGNPLTGSTGASMGPEFIDTFGYTDIGQRLEEVKFGTQAFKDLKQELIGHGVDYLTDKDLSQLISVSQQRAAQGIGKGALASYFDDRIKPQIDMSVNDMRGKIVTQVPKYVDFYVMHGMPNHPSFSGIEERAAYEAINKAGGGNIIHGHIHGKSTHKMGKNLLLNMGDGKQNFGVYHYDNGKVTDVFSRTYNDAMKGSEFKLIHSDQIGVQQDAKHYQ